MLNDKRGTHLPSRTKYLTHTYSVICLAALSSVCVTMAFTNIRPAILIFPLISQFLIGGGHCYGPDPLVVNTWPWTNATNAAYDTLINAKGTALDAVESGGNYCESNPNYCDNSVGFGGSPDENCETTLDALIMDGNTMVSGSVAGLRRVKHAISVARAVMEHTKHTLLAGDLATEFAASNGFPVENLTTTASAESCLQWKAGGCQPNYRVNVTPNASESCGPYTPIKLGSTTSQLVLLDDSARDTSHDTLSMIVIHESGGMAAGTTTNGANHKVPGRVGDGPITGSGSYVDSDVGACGATGDGDIMMRFLPCYQAVENLRRGMSPLEAAEDAVRRMLRKFPKISSGLIVVNSLGEHAGAASGWTGRFVYSVRGLGMNETKIFEVPNITL